MNLNKKRLGTILITMILCLAAGSFVWSQTKGANQRRQGNARRNPLIFLERAIQKSGAPTLTSDQQSQLESLIRNYRSAQKTTGRDPAVQSAGRNLESAVLSGNSANATTAADALARALASDLPKHLEARANFEAQAFGILRPQATALQQNIGNRGMLALLGSLAGGPGINAGRREFGR
jgi:hypothetical protein